MPRLEERTCPVCDTRRAVVRAEGKTKRSWRCSLCGSRGTLLGRELIAREANHYFVQRFLRKAV